MFNKLKQFKDLKDKAKTIQTALGDIHAEGEAGLGKVKVTVSGNQQVTAVVIDPSVLSDGPKLQDMVKDATNNAMDKMQKQVAGKVREMGGLDIMQEMQSAIKK